MSNLGSKYLKKTSSQVPTMKNGATEASSNIDKASLFNEVFSMNFSDALPPLSESDRQCFLADPSSPPPEISFAPNRRSSCWLPWTETSGPDAWNFWMLKGTVISIALVQTELVKTCWSQVREFLQNGNWSSAVPIHKSSANVNNLSNYRPIPLLSVVSKVMERLTYSIVFEHLAEREILSSAQWGFCPGESTVTALVSTFHNIPLPFSTCIKLFVQHACILTYNILTSV